LPCWEDIPISDVKVEKLRNSLAFIDELRKACNKTSGLEHNDQAALLDPPCHILDVDDPDTRLSLKLYMGTLNASDDVYNAVHEAILERHPEDKVLSLYQVKWLLTELTGVASIKSDMCINSCVAYTGPFEELTHCPYPECQEPCYDQEELAKMGKKVPRQVFHTIPIGPQLQAQWHHPDTAEKMKYRRCRTEEILKQMDPISGNLKLTEWDDVFCGQDYIELVQNRTIKTTDMVLLFSIDGAQLFAHKASDCWIYIWVILDLDPRIRYKKKYVLPGGIIPFGVNKVKNMDSFTYLGFHHLAVIQKEGLRVWDASAAPNAPDHIFVSHPYLFLSTADSPGQRLINGYNGHLAKIACWLFCGIVGRH